MHCGINLKSSRPEISFFPGAVAVVLLTSFSVFALDLSRKQVLQRKPLDVTETLGHTADMFNRILGEQVVLKFEIAPQLPALMADAGMFQQIILNLGVNARDAMSSGGRLTIRADEAKFAADDLSAKSNRKPGRFVRLSVADTGSGMDTAVIATSF
jgi:signal transduction histidine kinase